MNIAVFGAGGVGGYFGGRLAEAGEAVTFIARGAHLEAMKRGGLTVHSLEGDVTLEPVRAADNPAEVGPVDVVLLGVKVWGVPEAAEAMKPLWVPTPSSCRCKTASKRRGNSSAFWGGTMFWVGYAASSRL